MAELLGHEARSFLPTATMANQVALRVQTRPGCKLVAEERTHVLVYEWGGPAIHSGLVMQGARRRSGRPTPEQIEEIDELGRRAASSCSRTRTAAPADASGRSTSSGATVDAARERGAAVHLDGARLFNASVAAGSSPRRGRALADTVTICFSKGLGCPFGAVLAGSAEMIERAWEGKFLFGGALRQSGIAAAAMLYALDHNVERLADDHARAQAARRGDRPRSGDRRDELRLHSRRARPARAAARARRRRRRPPPRLAACGHASRHRRRRHRRRRSSAMQEVLVSTPETLARDSSSSSSGSSSARSATPSLAAAVLRDGELVWETAVGARRRRGGPRGDTGHAVPHRLDHEDVHGGRDHAAARRGQARPRGHARPPRRGRRAHAPTIRRLLSHASGLQRETQDDSWLTLRFAPPDELLETLARGRAGAPVRRALPLLEPRVRAARHRRRARLRACRTGITCASGSSSRVGLDARRASSPEPPAATGYVAQPYADGVWDAIGVEHRRVGVGGAAVGDGRRPLPLGRFPRGSRRVGAGDVERRGDAHRAGDRRPRALAVGLRARPRAAAATATGSSRATAARCRASSRALLLAGGEGRRRRAHERERGRARRARARARCGRRSRSGRSRPSRGGSASRRPTTSSPLLGIWFMEAARLVVPLAGREARGALRRDAGLAAVRRLRAGDGRPLAHGLGPEHGEALRHRARPDGTVERHGLGRLPGDARARPMASARVALTRTAALRARSASPRAARGRSPRAGRR